MTDRERLIKLKQEFVENFSCDGCEPEESKCRKCLCEKEADFLISNGAVFQEQPNKKKTKLLYETALDMLNHMKRIHRRNPYIFKRLEIAASAVQNRIPKVPNDITVNNFSHNNGYCPVCNCGVTSRWDNCQGCGQALDWEHKR